MLETNPGETVVKLDFQAGFTNLALLLSDQCPSFLKAAAFDDDERNAFLEREEYTGSLLAQLDSAYEFLESHNKFKTRYDGLDRKSVV